jgi:hypothetical protein
MVTRSIPILKQFKDSKLGQILKILSSVVPSPAVDEVNVVFVVSSSHLDLSCNHLNDLEEVLTDFSLCTVAAVIHTVHVVSQVGRVLSHGRLEPLKIINECIVIQSSKSQRKVDDVESCCSAKASDKGVLDRVLQGVSLEFSLKQRQDGD